MNGHEHIRIKSIRSEKIINREYKDKSILKSDLKDFIGNELKTDTNQEYWILISWIKELENCKILPFEMYTFVYQSPVTQESVILTIESE